MAIEQPVEPQRCAGKSERSTSSRPALPGHHDPAVPFFVDMQEMLLDWSQVSAETSHASPTAQGTRRSAIQVRSGSRV